MTVFTQAQHDSARELYYRHAEHQAEQFDAVMSLMPPEYDSVLDVGCGYGDFLGRLPKEVRYTGIDMNPKAIERARGADPNPRHKYRVTQRIVPADVIVAIASLSNDYVKPDVMLRRMWKNARMAVIFTTWHGHAPLETIIRWCPKPPDVMFVHGDAFVGAMYK